MAEITKVQENKKGSEDVEIDLLGIVFALLHRWWVIAISTVVVATLAFAYSYFAITPLYKSTTSIYIMTNSNNSDTISYTDTQIATTLTSDYEEMITSRSVLEKAIDQCGLSDSYESLKSRVAISNKTGTRILNITVTDEDPEMAQYIADSIRDIAAVHIKSVMNIEAVNMVDAANLPVYPTSPSIKKWTVIGAAIGFLIAAAFIIITVLMDDTVKNADDVENYLGWSTLALIPVMEEPGSSSKKSRKSSSSSSSSSSKNSSGKDSPKVVKRASRNDDILAEDDELDIVEKR